MTEWLRGSLQNFLRRFESGPCLQFKFYTSQVVRQCTSTDVSYRVAELVHMMGCYNVSYAKTPFMDRRVAHRSCKDFEKLS